MKQTRSLMGMHVTVEIVDAHAKEKDIDMIYKYFTHIDDTFSTYKKTSEISKINRGEIPNSQYSDEMSTILSLSEQTKKETNGYFDINRDGKIDPSGLVKGWSIWRAAKLLKRKGFKNFYVDAGGDIQVFGKNSEGKKWIVGIQNPFNRQEIVKVLALTGKGIATSGTAVRGQHIYNPHQKSEKLQEIVSLTVIGPNIYEADRFATAAFAMQRKGIFFIENLLGFEGYMIDANGRATYTSGFANYAS